MEPAVTFLAPVSTCQYLPDRSWQLRYELVSPLRPAKYMAAAATGLATTRLGNVPAGVPVLPDVPIARGTRGNVPPQFEPATGVEAKSGKSHRASRCAFSFVRQAGPVGEVSSSWP